MSEIKKTSGTKWKAVKELVEYMRTQGVDSFKVDGIEVVFGMSAPAPRESAPIPTTPEDREVELARIRDRMKSMAEAADADLFWSAPGS